MFYWYVCHLPFIDTTRFLIATPITFSPLRFLHPLLLFRRPHFVYVRPYVSLFTRKSTCLLAFKLEVYDPLIGFLLYNRVLFIMLNRQLKKETFLIKWGLSKNLQCMILGNCSYCYKYDKFFIGTAFLLLFWCSKIDLANSLLEKLTKVSEWSIGACNSFLLLISTKWPSLLQLFKNRDW